MNHRTLTAVLILLVAVGAFAFRLPRLRLRPMHADEANQAHKAGVLHDQGRYRYDPREHHGPTLYYLTQPVFWLSGARSFAESTETTYRLVPVLFGTGLVLLLLLVRDGLGRPEAAWAAVFTAVSPSLVYYSRYYIQEMLLVFFTFLVLAAAWRYKRTRGLGWALLAGAALGLMHGTKETCVLAYAAMALALGTKLAWRAWRDYVVRRARAESQWPGVAGPWPRAEAPDDEAPEPPLPGRPAYPGWHFLAAAGIGLALSVTLFSSLFVHPRGPLDSVSTYLTYLERSGGERAHEGPWHYYLSMLLYAGRAEHPWWVGWSFALVFLLVVAAAIGVAKRRGASIAHGHWAPRVLAVIVISAAAAYAIIPSVYYYVVQLTPGRPTGPWWSEGFVVALAVGGIAAAVTRCGVTRTHAPFVRFLAGYTLVMTVAYAAIPYKTPWNALGFLHGIILLAGVGAAAVVRILPTWPLQGVVACLLAVATYQYAGEAHRASYTFATYETNPYAYVHTSPDVLRLTERVAGFARVHPEGDALVIQVVADDPWPLPWYLRRLPRVGYPQDFAEYWNALAPGQPPPAVVIAAEAYVEPLNDTLGQTHRREVYGLRPGVLLTAFIENSLWQADQAAREEREK
jgi:hypothetical protein